MNVPMLVVLSFHSGDLSLAVVNLSLMQHLGGCEEFDCLLVSDDQTSQSEMRRIASQTFRHVEPLVLPNVPAGWPAAANVMFERTANHIQRNLPGVPFLFLEADTTPVRPGWLKDIAASYIANGLPFLGPIRNTFGTEDGTASGRRIVVGKHMNGVAAYPAGYYGQSDILRIVANAPPPPFVPMPFDVLLSDEQASRPFLANGKLTVGRMDSPLFSHGWKVGNFRKEGERFVCDQQDPRAECDEINPRVTAIFHGCKDVSLAELIRAEWPEGRQVARPAVSEIPAGVVATMREAEGNDPEYAEFLAWKAAKDHRALALKIKDLTDEVLRGATSDKTNALFDYLETNPNLTVVGGGTAADLWRELMSRGIKRGETTLAAPAIQPIPDKHNALLSEEEINLQKRLETAVSANREYPRYNLPAVVRPEPYAPISAESLVATGNGFQPPIPPTALPISADAHLEPLDDPAQRLAALPADATPEAVARAVEPPQDPLSQPMPPPQGAPTPLATPQPENLSSAPPAEATKSAKSPRPSDDAKAKREAVKADIRAKVPYRERLSKWGMTPKEMKVIQKEVDAEG